MDLNQIVVFERVCHLKSFTGAGLSLGLKKSTISMKISELENRLGVKLINRTTRKLSLTEAGQEFYQQARLILKNLKETEEKISQHGTSPKGIVRVVLPLDLGIYCINHFLKEFNDEYNDIVIDFTMTHQEMDPHDLGVDLVVRPSLQELNDSTLVAKKLFDSELMLYASAEYLKLSKEQKLKLSEYNFIQFDPVDRILPHVFNRDTKKYLGKDKRLEDLMKNTKYVFSDVYACKEACCSSLGAAILPSWLVHDEVKSKKLIPIQGALVSNKVSFYALYSSRKYLPKKTHFFIEAMKNHFKFSE